MLMVWGTPMAERAQIIDPVVLIRVPRLFRPGISALALYEATRGVWKIGPRRDLVKYALTVHEGIVQEVYEVSHWQPAWTTPYSTRTFPDQTVPGRWEFVGSVAGAAVRTRYLQKTVTQHLSRGAQNPITYVGVPV
jgi:hypothetical protein